MRGPQFLEYFIPIIEVLKENGGKGRTSDIVDLVIEHLNIPDHEVDETIPSGQSRIRNRIQWARFYLTKAGLMDSPKTGVWRLTQLGYESELDELGVYKLFRDVHKDFEKNNDKDKKKGASDSTASDIDDHIVADEAHSEELIDILKLLSAEGFERICKRLLTEIGLHDIVITGRSGDQGIDGIGLIQVNDVVNFNIVFQCKRYKDTVSPHYVRDFRGAMQGRADKGLILTTGRFTSESRKEATRDGVPPIELIDGERLVSLFEKYELGLKPRTVYEIDQEFFHNFK